MREIVRRTLEGMDAGERAEAAEEPRRLIAAGRAEDAAGREAERCPRCPRPSAVRRGRDGRGRQRWLCRGCGRSFTASTLGPVSWSRPRPEAWEEFARCMAGGVPPRVVCERCGVSVPTAWLMRVRACEAMAADLGPFRCGEGMEAQADGVTVPESLSGGGAFEMPRGPRRAGGQAAGGVPSERVCVLAGENSLGDVLAEVCCRGRATKARVREMLEGRLADGSVLAADAHRAHAGTGDALGVGAEHLAHRSGGEADARLSGVDAPHSRLAGFLLRMSGVPTRRPRHCLSWSCWPGRARRRGGGGAAIRDLNLSTPCHTSRRAPFKGPRYDMGYWEARNAV